MPEPVVLNIGEIPICLQTDTPAGQFNYVKKMADFIRDDQPEITLRVQCGVFPEIPQEIIFSTNVGWQLGRFDNKLVIGYPKKNGHQLGVFPTDFSSGDIYVGSKKDGSGKFIFPLAYPMGELFIMNVLGAGRGVMLHAAGVIYQGEGYLFPGRGGAGKTTIARLWNKMPGASVINDDKVILRKNAGNFTIHGTPWHGEGGFASPQSAPLKGIYLLKQADHNFSESLPALDAVLRLMHGGFLPLWDQHKMDFTLSFLSELVQSVPTLEFGFLPNPSSVEFLLNV